MTLSDEATKARRLARAIVSDVALYNQAKIEEGIVQDNLFEVLEDELEEGRKLYLTRISPSIAKEYNFYDLAIVDVLVKQSGKVNSEIW